MNFEIMEPWDPAEHLETREDMAAYLEDGDPAVVSAAFAPPHNRIAKNTSAPAPQSTVGAVPTAAASNPPSSGPMALPTFRQAPNTPIAAPRCPSAAP